MESTCQDIPGVQESLNDDDLADIRQLIDLMQSGLVELFDQLRELREHLNLIPGLPGDTTPTVMPLFSEAKKPVDRAAPSVIADATENVKKVESNDEVLEPPHDSQSDLQPVTSEKASEVIDRPSETSGVNARVGRVLDPIVQELKTGEATADIILEYLQAAKDYLIDDDDDERKKKVARDMDIVLNFLRARGKRSIRSEERDNILNRIRRWKAHLVSYSDSPAG
jgi:hypothetical protein